MSRSHLHQVLSVPGTFESLLELDKRGSTSDRLELLSLMEQEGIAEPDTVIEGLISAQLLQRLGVRFALSTFGIRSLILLQALNGDDLELAYQKLRGLDSGLSRYELVREGMTKEFLTDVHARPDFARLYLCSPWIRLDKLAQDLLTHSIQLAERNGQRPEILVITRPAPDGTAPAGVSPLYALGATIFLHRRLHTKLYIREPGIRGGYSLAVIGSQNMTLSNYLELGIRINSDGLMIDRLIKYFLDVTTECTEV